MKNKWKTGSAFLTPLAIIGVFCNHYEQGMEHISSGNFDLAVELFSEVGITEHTKDTIWSLDRVQATYGLALCHWFGVGDMEPNRNKAAEILEKMFDNLKDTEMPNLSNPQYLLGKYYESKGTDEARMKAVTWYEKAARSGHSMARFRLGNIYHELAEEYRQDGRNYDLYEMKAEKYLRLARHDLDLSKSNREKANELYALNSVPPTEGSWEYRWMECEEAYYYVLSYIRKYSDYLRYL